MKICEGNHFSPFSFLGLAYWPLTCIDDQQLNSVMFEQAKRHYFFFISVLLHSEFVPYKKLTFVY